MTCRVTVLIFSAQQGKVCFNPLIAIDERETISALQHKAIEKYNKKAENASLSVADVIETNVVNAGVVATIPDDCDTVLDMLGKEATITLVVRDATVLLRSVPVIPSQLLTPGPSASPSLDLNSFAAVTPLTDRLQTRLAGGRKSGQARKRKSVGSSMSALCAGEGPEDQHTEPQSGRRAKRRRKRRQTHDTPTMQESFSKQSSSLLPSVQDDDDDDDGFQFSRHPLASGDVEEDNATTVESVNMTPQQLRSTKPDGGDHDSSRDAEIPQTSELRRSTGETPQAIEAELTHTADCVIENRNLVAPAADRPVVMTPASSTPLTESNLKLLPTRNSDGLNPQSPVADISLISVASSSIHDSHVQESLMNEATTSLQARSAVLVTDQQTSNMLEISAESGPSQAKQKQATPIESSASSISGNSDLADFLSTTSSPLLEPLNIPPSTQSQHDMITDLRSIERSTTPPPPPPRGPPSDDSDDSSSMKSGVQSSQESVITDRSEVDVDDEENVHKPTTFEDIDQSSPDYTQQSEPVHARDTGTQSPLSDSPPKRENEHLPMRPTIRSSYRPLSFLHDQSMRAKDDLTKLAQSPTKGSLLGGILNRSSDNDSQDEVEDESDGSSTDSSDSAEDESSHLPAEKRASSVRNSAKKRQSQGAKGLMSLL